LTKPGVDIRVFGPNDWDAVCEIYERSAALELARSGLDARAFRPMADEEDRETFPRLNSALLACIDGRVVGFVAWRPDGYLSWLYVDPAHHRCGIGGRLLDEAMERLGPEAWTLAKCGNDPAITLYQGRGMEIVRSRPATTWGYPHIELRLALSTSRKHNPDVPNFGE
jgi:ribosomal protein S18 acetylase RimI-like enzyme